MSEDLTRREVLLAGAALFAPKWTQGEWCDRREVDTALEDRHQMLVDALLAEDLDTLLDASEEELDRLGGNADLVAVVPDCRHIIGTAKWWGYMKRTMVQAGKPFELPPVVRENLHFRYKAPEDPYAGTYGMC